MRVIRRGWWWRDTARMAYLLRLTAEHVAYMEPEKYAVDDLRTNAEKAADEAARKAIARRVVA